MNRFTEVPRQQPGPEQGWRLYARNPIVPRTAGALVGFGFALGTARWGEAQLGFGPALVRPSNLVLLLAGIGAVILCQKLLKHAIARRQRKQEAATPPDERIVGVAHAWKNAVHSLRGFTALLESRIGDREDAIEVLRGLGLVIDQVADLVHTTLEWNGAPPPGHSAGRGPELRRHIESARKAIESVHPGIRLRVVYYSRLPGELALPGSILSEVLTNLLRNAAEAMEGEGEIQLQVRTTGDRCTIEIKDHGLGIAEQDVGKLFQPGFTTKPEGSGFGLFHTRNLLRAYDGEVIAQRGARGGAVFIVEVPAREARIHEQPLSAHC